MAFIASEIVLGQRRCASPMRYCTLTALPQRCADCW